MRFILDTSEAKCSLMCEADRLFVVSERGERYIVSRIRSRYEKEHNGIGLSLDDISIGIFQREDILLEAKRAKAAGN